MFDIKPFKYHPEASVEEKLNVLLDYLKSKMLEIVGEKGSNRQLSIGDNDAGEY